MSFVPRQLTELEIVSLHAEFLALSKDSAKKQAAWQEMDSFFRTASVKDDVLYWNTFFLWYTALSWETLNTFENDFILGVAAPRQLLRAILLGFDVFSDLTWYLQSRTKDASDMMGFYTKLKQNIFLSPSIVGQFQGKDVTLSELIKEVIDLNRLGNDSLKVAEFLTKLKKILYKQEDADKGYIWTSSEEVVDKFFNLIHFFIGVEPKRIYYVIDAMFHPERYENIPADAVNSPNTDEVIDTLASEVAAEQNQAISYEEIKQKIDADFAKDETGQYQNIEGVFDVLDQMAVQYNDETIKELLYFDEDRGGFVWKETK